MRGILIFIMAIAGWAIGSPAAADPIVAGPIVATDAPVPGEGTIRADAAVRADAARAIELLIAPAPRRRLARDAQSRMDLAEHMAGASAAYGVPPLLLVVLAFCESSFRPDVVGSARGEIGLVQVHGLAARGCALATPWGQLACGARWLRVGYEQCGTWEGAVTAYASGRCRPPSDRVAAAVRSRMRLWANVRRLARGGSDGHR